MLLLQMISGCVEVKIAVRFLSREEIISRAVVWNLELTLLD